ncbi:MAG TPA: transketolase C-terminal domain-containing protein [Candidatus Acidoferrum sp.]|nr:transketolase C-terminal domain-containing protein [Candidatus Acidoferrum sp.]
MDHITAMDKIASTREAFIAGLLDVAPDDPKICLVFADSLKAARATPFTEKYPDRWFDVGICEQNAVAFSAGLASTGLKPFFNTYAGFITMRACEQVRSFVAYPHLNVKLVGLNGGIYGGEREGVTHMVFEEFGILRSIAGMDIVVPADAGQVRKATRALAQREGPGYMRLGSGREPVIFDDAMPFDFGKARVLREYGTDAAIFAVGPILKRAILAAETLAKEGIKTTLVEVHTLKPLDQDTIAEVLRKTRAAVTLEDHNIHGGLGSAVAEVIAEREPATLIRLGLRDVFAESGDAELLFDHFGMGAPHVCKAVKQLVARKRKS